jgi:hypothetical protein
MAVTSSQVRNVFDGVTVKTEKEVSHAGRILIELAKKKRPVLGKLVAGVHKTKLKKVSRTTAAAAKAAVAASKHMPRLKPLSLPSEADGSEGPMQEDVPIARISGKSANTKGLAKKRSTVWGTEPLVKVPSAKKSARELAKKTKADKKARRK